MALVLLTWWVAKLGFGDWAWVELSDTAASVYRLSIDLAFKKGLTTHMFQIIYIYIDMMMKQWLTWDISEPIQSGHLPLVH